MRITALNIRLYDRPIGMLGSLRLILAASVVASHAGLGFAGMGYSAVIGFYIISGYAMTGLLTRRFADMPRGVGYFYLDRSLRLMPQYYVWLVVTVVLAFGLKIDFGSTLSAQPTSTLILENIIVIPLNFYMLLDRLPNFTLVPTGWSLGVEIFFYLLLPFMLRNINAIWTAATISLSVAFLAADGIIDQDVFGFRLLPGVLVFFLLGHAIYRRDVRLIAFIMLGLSACAVTAWTGAGWTIGMIRPIAAGWLFCGPLVFCLSCLPPRRWDTRLGEASYGCYLCQWLLVPLMRLHQGSLWWGCLFVALAIALGMTGFYLVDRPVSRLRHRLEMKARRESMLERF